MTAGEENETPQPDGRAGKSGPSRVDNQRQRRIADLIEGYDSAVTLASGVRILLVAWLVPAIGSLVVAVMSLLEQSDLQAGSTADRVLAGTRSVSIALFLTTAVAVPYWTTRVWSNLSKVGPSPRLPVWSRLRFHLVGFGLAVLGLILRSFVGGEDGVVLERVTFIMILVGFVVGLSVIPVLLVDLYRLLWRRSAGPTSGSTDIPAEVVWLGFALVVALSATVSRGQESAELATILLMMQAVAAGVSGVIGARLVAKISQRQDARLLYILASSAEGRGQPRVRTGPVTDSQIDSAWEDSDRLVTFT